MTEKEIVNVFQKVPNDLGTVKWVHDNLPEEGQNESSIINLLNQINANPGIWQGFDYIVNSGGKLPVL